jgi:hypothetical protein
MLFETELFNILSGVLIASDSKYYSVAQMDWHGAGIFVSCFIF